MVFEKYLRLQFLINFSFSLVLFYFFPHMVEMRWETSFTKNQKLSFVKFYFFPLNAGGLPLALKVLGSFLFGRTIAEQESALQWLYRDPESEILDALQMSFDGSKGIEKKIFLAIVCFYEGKYRDYVKKNSQILSFWTNYRNC